MTHTFYSFNSSNLLQDLISVVESKPAKRYGDYFLRQIVKVCRTHCYPILFSNIREMLSYSLFLISWTFFVAAWRCDQWYGQGKAWLIHPSLFQFTFLSRNFRSFRFLDNDVLRCFFHHLSNYLFVSCSCSFELADVVFNSSNDRKCNFHLLCLSTQNC